MTGPTLSAQIGRAISRAEPPRDESRVNTGHIIAGGMLIAGAAALVLGVALISIAIALIVGGLLLMSAAVIVAKVNS